MEETTARLAREFPHPCNCCGALYARAGWDALPFAYELKDAFGRHEARNCLCGSTLMVVLEVFDLSAE